MSAENPRKQPERIQGLIPTVGQILRGEGVQGLSKSYTNKNKAPENMLLVNVATPDKKFNAHVNATLTSQESILGDTVTVSWLDKNSKEAGEIKQWIDNGRIKRSGFLLSKINAKLIKIWEDCGGADMFTHLVENGALIITPKETEELASKLGDAHPNPEMTETATLYYQNQTSGEANVTRTNTPHYKNNPSISSGEENE